MRNKSKIKIKTSINFLLPLKWKSSKSKTSLAVCHRSENPCSCNDIKNSKIIKSSFPPKVQHPEYPPTWLRIFHRVLLIAWLTMATKGPVLLTSWFWLLSEPAYSHSFKWSISSIALPSTMMRSSLEFSTFLQSPQRVCLHEYGFFVLPHFILTSHSVPLKYLSSFWSQCTWWFHRTIFVSKSKIELGIVLTLLHRHPSMRDSSTLKRLGGGRAKEPLWGPPWEAFWDELMLAWNI